MSLLYMLTDWLSIDPAAHGIIIGGVVVMAIAVMLWLVAPPGDDGGGNWIAWVFAIGAVLAVGGFFVSDYMREYYLYY